MSNTAALALVVASISAGFAGYLYASKWGAEVSHQIVTGTAHGLPLPASWRWRLLYGRWLYIPVSIAGFTAIVAAVNVRIADLASDQGIVLVAYFGAALSALVAINWLIYGGA